MALSPLFRMDHQFPASRRPSLIDRVKSVGQFLTSDKAKTIAFVGSSAAMGAAAKFSAVAILSSVGVTAAAGLGSALAVAMVGGAAVGVAKTGLSYLFNRNAVEKPTTKTLVKNVLLGSALSGATFGILSGGDALLHHTEIGRQVAEKAVSFYHDTVPKIMSSLSGVWRSIGYAPVVARPEPPIMPITFPAVETLSPNEVVVPDVAPAPAHHASVEKVAARVHHTYEPAPASADYAPVVEDAPVVDTAAEELAIAQKASTDEYVMERLRGFVLTTTGVEPPADASPLELAKQMSENDPEAVLKSLEQQAPKLDREHMAAFCKSDVPTSFGSENTINTHCEVLKPEMGEQDFMTVRNMNEPESKKGLRVLFAKARSMTAGFIDRVAVREVVAEMTETAQKDFAEKQTSALVIQ